MINFNEKLIENGRIYEINNIPYPSVTTIINNTLKHDYSSWKEKNTNWNEILKYASLLGTLTHYIFSKKILTKWNMRLSPLELTDDDKITFKTYLNNPPKQENGKYTNFKKDINQITKMIEYWITEYNPQPLDYNEEFIFPSEGLIYSNELMYAGRFDLICNINNENYLIDIKTSKFLPINYDYQLTAYRYALEEKYKNINIKNQNILNLEPNKEDYKFIKTVYLQEYWKNLVVKFYETTNIQDLNQTKNNFLRLNKLL